MSSGRRCASRTGLTTINLALGLGGPAPRIIPAQEGLAHVASLASALDAPGSGGELREGGHFRVRSVCTQPSKRGEKRRITACFRVHSDRLNDLMLHKKL